MDFTGAASLHNSHIEVWKSDSPEDISAFTKVEMLGDWTPEYAFAYPNVYKLSDGIIVCICRSKGGVGGDYGDGEERYFVAMKSEDNGATWTDMDDTSDTTTSICKLDNNGAGWRLYPIHGNEYGGINLAAQSYDEAAEGDPHKDIYFLHSDDGVTWENARQFVEGSGGYSKNVVSVGTITGAQLDTNFRIDSLPDGDSISLTALSAGVDRNGIPYVLANKNNRANDSSYNNSTNIYMYYYDVTTHAWITVDVLPNMILSGNSDFDVVPRFRASMIPYENGLVDIITGVMDKDNSDFESDAIINSGSLTAGLFYKVVATNGGFGTQETGTHTGGNNAATLTDAGASFGDLIGKVIYNITDGSSGVITANTSNTVTAVLSGGTDDDWDTGDAYQVRTYEAGDVFRSAGTESPDGSNTVIEIKAKIYRFRSNDYGASFQPLKLPGADYKYGGIGTTGYNINCVESGRLMVYYPVFEMTLGTKVEYQNFLMWHSDLNK